METTTQIIRPQRLPQTQRIRPFELALVPDQQHAEEEEEIGRVGRLQVQIEFGVHKLYEVVESEKLGAHARLVAEEITFLGCRR